jgi:hypothetical protein
VEVCEARQRYQPLGLQYGLGWLTAVVWTMVLTEIACLLAPGPARGRLISAVLVVLGVGSAGLWASYRLARLSRTCPLELGRKLGS